MPMGPNVVHLKRRDYACPYCEGVAFGKKGNLETHIETVHEKRRDHACLYCEGVTFGQKCSLTNYIQSDARCKGGRCTAE